MRTAPLLLLALVAACSSSPAQTAKDSNALACDSYRMHVGDTTKAFTDLSAGTITMADALKGIKDGQQNASDSASYSSGVVSASLSGLADALGRTRVAMTSQGEAGLTTPLSDEIVSTIHAADAACTAIKH